MLTIILIILLVLLLFGASDTEAAAAGCADRRVCGQEGDRRRVRRPRRGRRDLRRMTLSLLDEPRPPRAG